jgi:hypothetical protein
MIKITKDNAADFLIILPALKEDFEELASATKRYPIIVEFPKDEPKYQLVFSSRQELHDRIELIEKELNNLDNDIIFNNVDSCYLEQCKTFNDIMSGPNPLTNDELKTLIEKRPSIWGKFKSWLR